MLSIIPYLLPYFRSFGNDAPELSKVEQEALDYPCENCVCRAKLEGKEIPEFAEEPTVGKYVEFSSYVYIIRGKRNDEWPKTFLGEWNKLKGFLRGLRKYHDKKLPVRMAFIASEPKDQEGYDLLIAPQMERIDNVKLSDMQQVLDDYYNPKVNFEKYSEQYKITQLKGTHVFVCCHAKADVRCALRGPEIYDEFNNQFQKQNIVGKVHATSCLSQHTNAALVHIYHHEKERDVYRGEIYGCLNEEKVAPLVTELLVNKKMVADGWIGRCGLENKVAEKLLMFLMDQN